MRARPESFGVEELFGNGNDNVPVKGDFRVRLITHGHALQIVTRVPLSFSDLCKTLWKKNWAGVDE
jgi:hypothetical protein